MANTVPVLKVQGQMLSSHGEANYVNVDGCRYWEVLPEYVYDAGGMVFQAQTESAAKKALATGNFKALELLA